ncbi:TIGR03943 family protein [Enterococcus sp. JM4C]|uniref:TIGR03943 family putative permease subunit n=1 Tax=Candidatus Enterococcus huntleyi TaxID=1857217 RepID=UPI00137A371D|nr:TIGR03943 family protein [Enterococcus sp. JM4C]KAF1295690.1 TIGR03943 family protein [Enterococcus sp. JM4C]
MFRLIILAGYFELMAYLQISGKLDQYINVHYQYLAILSMVLSFVLAVVQLVLILRNKEHQVAEDDPHEHHLTKGYQKASAYLLLALPIIVGLLFPTISLDTTIVEAKGFNFPISKESVGDPDVQTQYLKPDTSIYFNEADYQEQMDTLLEKYDQQGTLKITEANYLEIMELIYNYPSAFIGRAVSYDGFIYQAKNQEISDLFVFRFGIIHCVADSGVFGLRTKLPHSEEPKNDTWVHIEGTIQSEYYAPFKRTLPFVDANTVTTIATPENQYVYRSF